MANVNNCFGGCGWNRTFYCSKSGDVARADRASRAEETRRRESTLAGVSALGELRAALASANHQ